MTQDFDFKKALFVFRMLVDFRRGIPCFNSPYEKLCWQNQWHFITSANSGSSEGLITINLVTLGIFTQAFTLRMILFSRGQNKNCHSIIHTLLGVRMLHMPQPPSF